MAQLNLRTMTDDEKERLYYQAGMPEVAAIYAQAADVQAENDEYQDQVEKMVDGPEYDKVEKLVEHLQDHIRAACTQLDEIYAMIEDASRLNKKAILAAIGNVKLDADSEP